MVCAHYTSPSALRIFLDIEDNDCGAPVKGGAPLLLNNPLHKQFAPPDFSVTTNL